MKIKVLWNGQMYDAEVIEDFKVKLTNKESEFFYLILDQCHHCGAWKSENEELYGEGFCSQCSAMCYECEGYFNYVDMIPPDIEAGQEEPVCKECNLKMAKKLWAEFGDVPIDENEDIDTDWREFLKGTNKFTIWHWFEAEYNVSIAKDLQCT